VDTVEISPFEVINAIHKAVDKFKKLRDLLAVPFNVHSWGTDKINYDCSFCFKNDRLLTGDIPYYCAHPEIKDVYALTGAKPLRCNDCDFYQQR
jgi:hypothetical protein